MTLFITVPNSRSVKTRKNDTMQTWNSKRRLIARQALVCWQEVANLDVCASAFAIWSTNRLPKPLCDRRNVTDRERSWFTLWRSKVRRLYHPGLRVIGIGHQAWSKWMWRDISLSGINSDYVEPRQVKHHLRLDRGDVFISDKLKPKEAARPFFCRLG